MRTLTAIAVAGALVLAVSACGGSDVGDGKAEPQPGTSKASISQVTTPSQAPAGEPGTPPLSTHYEGMAAAPSDMSDRAKQDLLGLKTLELQVALREIDPSLGAPADVNKAVQQCVRLRSDNDSKDAAQRFSSPHHQVTEADGKRINAMLRERFCP
ncbi:hypothetical protein [Streptomyces zagrosensis]|uniref:DUF732 domain-containing protein n=1 Tax=Streptomyces zagrosensis TaxID=1042984 RepID=A0A7W9QBJ3_9ACTN|nr:hypothetical protein [Streptomyces zagrosensis]MBB5937129.1 hypothetical protein [Streptomyces zagrosensis]